MKNLNQIISQLSNSKFKFEITGCNSSLNTLNENHLTLDVRISDGKWATFYSYDEIDSEDCYFFFKSVYNCNTGKTIKAWNTGYKLRQKLNLNSY